MGDFLSRINKSRRGFTLAEILIVTAIVLALIVIAVPVFASSMHNSKWSSDEANAKAVYAELMSDYYGNNCPADYLETVYFEAPESLPGKLKICFYGDDSLTETDYEFQLAIPSREWSSSFDGEGFDGRPLIYIQCDDDSHQSHRAYFGTMPSD